MAKGLLLHRKCGSFAKKKRIIGGEKLKILDEKSVVLPKNKALFCYYDENGNQKICQGTVPGIIDLIFHLV
ncbi:MAG: hypothetical protein IKP52_03675 [Prevotella sp.]|nr:hypothetical protein [Prevotella sp.]